VGAPSTVSCYNGPFQVPLTRSAFTVPTLRLAVAALVIAVPSISGQAPVSGLALRGATIYPAPESAPIHDGIVITRNGRIEAVGPRAGVTVPPGMPVIDLTGQVLVAGFWNSHVHFAEPFASAETAPAAQLSTAAREMLTRWGFTTVFDTGSELTNTLALRKRIESGAVDGPRIFTTGNILYPIGAKNPRFQVGTASEALAASKTLLDGGADAIKVYAQAFWDLKLKLSPEVLAAVRAETRRRNVQMFAHPSNRDGLHNAIEAGIDVLVHTTPQIGPWGSELVAKMKASNIALIPTLKLWRFELARDKAPEAVIVAFQRRGIDQLREYFSAGGPILFGTDVGYMTDFSTVEEFQTMAQAGMGFRDLLASLTTVPAGRRGLGARLGRVAVGFDADLVALRSDPSLSVSALADVAYTIRGGRILYSAK
jgi:imidazolonepropionase-like amidohydrolase